ncbi:DUF2303 family protein [Acinetobacter ursingii]|uniref:DUF2303 family protein n=1 Tax=Acinetobacter ursingii TaxID=108980 RepID=UPI00249A7A53|nr:DUF2303 family protein [Acinetobacter ursingii]MDI3237539.1 DUF2303 family protein [Acinetobacter ursingii]
MENTEANAIVELAKPGVELGRGDLAAIHEKYSVMDLEEFQDGRNRARGILSTPSFEDFKSYVLASSPLQHDNEFVIPNAAPVFVDHKNMCAVALLNYYQQKYAQGHCDHKAILQLEPTVVWKKLQNIKDRKLSQRDFAVFLEDWVSVLEITDADGNVIGGAQALAAVRNMQIGASVKVDAAVGNLSESRSRFEQVEARSNDAATPAYFKIHDPAYVGLDSRLIVLRILINTSDEKPVFALQIVQEELILDEIVKEFKGAVLELLPENPVRIGTFQA